MILAVISIYMPTSIKMTISDIKLEEWVDKRIQTGIVERAAALIHTN